ncbi:MAG: glycosyl transferase family protein, partial [Gemmatimonadota bacterium]
MIDSFVPWLLVGLSGLLAVLIPVFVISGVDDFFIDLFYIGRALRRTLGAKRRHRPLEEQQLQQVREKPVAIMIPAWDESAVISRMLENTLATLDYGNYEIFVGSYPNDPATAEEVDRVRARATNVHTIVCPHPGPTSKADCLNWVYHGIRDFEREHDIEFAVFVMHDAEDIVHPLSVRLFNYLIPRKDMVQLPVFPLEVRWRQLTAGHYMDDFAEHHQKDLVAREFMSGELPSAGTGCAFSRAALRRVEQEGAGELFNTTTVTEDYDFGIRLSRLGLKAVFVKQALVRVRTRRTRTGRLREERSREYIATRERFPARLREAVRQKSRWTVGIAMQGWRSVGWRGVARHDYMLFRDRKGVVTAIVNVLAYLVVLGFLAVFLLEWLGPGYRYPPLVEPGSLLWKLLWVVTFFMVWRVLIRMYFVGRIYGWRQAVPVPVRLVWGNFINFAADVRAIRLFIRHLVTGVPIAWDATDHTYPKEDELLAYRSQLGDLLLEKRFVTRPQLEEALRVQALDGRLLGDVLLAHGFVDEDHLVHALGIQFNVSTATIDPYETPLELLERFPRRLAIRHDAFPLGTDEHGKLVLGTTRLLSRQELDELEELVGTRIEVVLSARSDVAFAIRRGYERLEQDERRPALGAQLVAQGLITEEQLEAALRQQRRTYARLGQLLLDDGAITLDRLEEALARHAREAPDVPLGEFMVENSYITRSVLE